MAAAQAGADGYIVRPFKLMSLQKKLESILSRRQLAILDLPGQSVVQQFTHDQDKQMP
ncbi:MULTISPECIES: hypothetical protein [unclassified Undibacterium]|nr:MULTISPECIES: hypothetical protein [unclassified Undibacterium]